MLSVTDGANLLDAKSWKKNALPIFQQAPSRHVFAPGHNCFFKSPNGKEDWILYHANSQSGQGCGAARQGHKSLPSKRMAFPI
ncbi:family 43 glycosylhydrolase [Siphonobacter sp. SORGH_AS_1065]|uniref:family 43 glycosylhydrolase n=1 Tax=Siphonobacter sp. SORGH_AS_1065 TaxID=3041795 RepID=UPI00278A7FBE|nr:family 43 glycosylhydrolase [Siphonobacter sp. SORGH_AS_1065]MDQ1090524.1 GH43 family beta-xylosidase [Siphonobacter sp. SORGH_AS_1065]